MKELFGAVREAVDVRRLMEDTGALWKIESGQTFRHYRRAARFVEKLMLEAGFERVERIPVPADGETVFQDKTMPLAWTAGIGKLEVVKSPQPFRDPVLADFRRHPFHLAKDSAATPPGGALARIVLEDDFFAGAVAKNAFVLLNPETRARGEVYAAVADAGALGVVSTYLSGRFLTPDSTQWLNSFAEGPGWHRRRDERPLIAFTVSPRTGEALAAAVRRGEVLVRATSDARVYKGTFDTVTGVIPGEEEKELWLMGHLYEPLADDNSAGVVCAVEVARALRRMVAAGTLPRPRFTLRLLFSLEMYGFAAYAEKRGGCLRDQVLGAWNLDGLPIARGSRGRLYFSPSGAPFFGDYLLEELARSGAMTEPVITALEREGAYFDDMFLADSTTGLATVWLIKDTFDPVEAGKRRLWHNSAQTMEIIDLRLFRETAAFVGAWTASVLGLEEPAVPAAVRRSALMARGHMLDELRAAEGEGDCAADTAAGRLEHRRRREAARLADFRRVSPAAEVEGEIEQLARVREMLLAGHRRRENETPASPEPEPVPWRVAAAIVPRRVGRGFPYDLDRVPRSERRALPDGVIYGPLARLLSLSDGEKDLAALLREAQWETGAAFSPAQVRAYNGAFQYLARHGYLELEYRRLLDRAGLVAAMRRTGLAAGDLVLVHGGLSALGPVPGGADDAVDALLEVLGPRGTLLMPTFTPPFACLGGQYVRRRHARPWHPEKSVAITGAIAECFRRRPGVLRSAHPTHSVAGIGPLARDCLAGHRAVDPPAGARSPFAGLVRHGGKMAWLGADLAATTFLHFLEDQLRLPYLAPAICLVAAPGGRVRKIVVPDHLPGHRDFYRVPGEQSAVYRRLVGEGLEIRRAPAGFGELKVIEARPFHEIGSRVIAAAPDILLCRGEDCLFCRESRELVRKKFSRRRAR